MMPDFSRTIRIAGILLLIPFIVVVQGCQNDHQSTPQTANPPTSAAPPAQPAASVPISQMPPAAVPQNMGQIQMGMTGDQVRQMMGNPTQIKQEGAYVEWKYYTSSGKLEIKFQNDRVAFIETH
ncbi:MAG: hypothetical protein WCR46_07590 [Deltaproteobacteria bacterium]